MDQIANRSSIEDGSSNQTGSTGQLNACQNSTALGKPCKQPRVSRSQVGAVVLSLICLVLGTVTISPTAGWAWRLGFKNQIVIIGFLLSVMEKCTDVILSSVFLLMETKHGRSQLQNYQAILTKNLTASKVSLAWRIILAVLVGIPFGLSIAYKQFTGGTARGDFTPDLPGSYGLDFPRIGAWASPTDSLYLLLTSLAPFQASTNKGEGPYPQPHEFPLAYGYNILALNNNSAAILDVPTNSYISALQRQLLADESLNMTADVDAYISTHDSIQTASLKTNDTLWEQTMNSSISIGHGGLQGGLYTIELYQGQGARLGVMHFGSENNKALIALYYNSKDYGDMFHYTDPFDSESLRFRQRAQMYTLRRARCGGEWQLNSTGIFLQRGSCRDAAGGGAASNGGSEAVLQRQFMMPYAYNVLPTLSQVISGLAASRDSRAGSGEQRQGDLPWLRATYSVGMAAAYWARGVYMTQPPWPPLVPYGPVNERLVSTRSTLKASAASPLLYLVLAVHPLLSVLGFGVICWMVRLVPVGHEFSFVSILSGLDPEGLSLIRGAGLSGELKEAVRLDVEVRESTEAEKKEGRVVYRLRRKEDARGKRTTGLRSGWLYH
ncbi:hypothetical protein QBC44DRAFT_389030 [Cladorrhinum sp. PSN332]|nr:hypothetical protein QBC44DRAFT_389030 [Cladorrhinum sp. PSN332]